MDPWTRLIDVSKYSLAELHRMDNSALDAAIERVARRHEGEAEEYVSAFNSAI